MDLTPPHASSFHSPYYYKHTQMSTICSIDFIRETKESAIVRKNMSWPSSGCETAASMRFESVVTSRRRRRHRLLVAVAANYRSLIGASSDPQEVGSGRTSQRPRGQRRIFRPIPQTRTPRGQRRVIQPIPQARPAHQSLRRPLVPTAFPPLETCGPDASKMSRRRQGVQIQRPAGAARQSSSHTSGVV